MANRFDIGTLASPRELPDGRLIVDAKLTRTGVFPYRNPDGSTRLEYRPPSEVFDVDSLSTFQYTSVTNDHPDEMVSTENAQRVTVGTVGGNARKLDTHVAAELVIFDAQAIADIKAGKLEISCGYEAEVEESPGVSPSGERYDCIQSKIRINHVAIVDVGRAGPEARIRMDAAMQIPDNKPEQVDNMELDKLITKVAELEVKTLTLGAQVVTEKARADKAEAERDAQTERADKAEKSHKDSADGFDNKVKARVKLCFDAAKVLEGDLSGKTDREIKVDAVKAITDFDITAEHSDEYLEARYDIAIGQNVAADESREPTKDIKHTDSVDDSDKAREAMMKRYADKGKA